MLYKFCSLNDVISKRMSRGQSQPSSQQRRVVLERCKTKLNAEIIDVDKDKTDVVIGDAPETSRQASKVPIESRRNCSPTGVISIDDEEGDTDDTPKIVHDDATSKGFWPASSNSPISEDSESDDCLMYVGNGNFFCKSTQYQRMYPEMGSSRNRFGLDSTSGSSISESETPEYDSSLSGNSESDSSDCEIMEDLSGDIRKQWERAALRKKMSEKGKYGSEGVEELLGSAREQWETAAFSRKMSERGKFGPEDQASTSGSSSNLPPHEATQNEVDHENHRNKDISNHFDEMPPESSHSNLNNSKDNLFFGTSADKHSGIPLRTTLNTSDSDPAADVHNEEPGYRKEEHFSESMKARSQDPEMSEPGPFFGHSIFQHDGNANDNGMKDNQTTVGTNELHDESSFQEKEEAYPGKVSLSNPQTPNGKQASLDTVELREEKECVPGERSCHTQLESGSFGIPKTPIFQSKENPVFEATSMSNTQSAERLQFNSENDWFCRNREPTIEELVCSSVAGSTRNERILSSQTEPEDAPEVLTGLIGERERHKESDEYKRAVEEEWASRERELQIQAEEAQRLRRRRKAEILRLHDVEKRQKLRLEEIRESQRKDTETINLKEQLRAEIRKKLENMEVRYRDMASLLRGLGIHVEGGPFPVLREVNAAYKQALLRFHPDRASKTNIRQQVEAEETFKMISRLKEKLLPVL